MAFRETLVREGLASDEFKLTLWKMCSRDVLFYINTCVYTYDPRKMMVLPFITYPFQDEAIVEIDCSIAEQYPLNIKKSRDMGASWMALSVYDWRMKFRRNHSFLLLSRKQELVDKTGDLDSLFGKLDFISEHQPKWLVPEFVRNELHLAFPCNRTVVDGESTNKDAGRGGRRTSLVWDEAAATPNAYEVTAATANNCNNRIRIYTPRGTGTEAYSSEKTTRTVKLHWTLHPEHRRGLYTTRDGRTEVLDKDYKFPDDYPFVVDVANQGKPRSVWYDTKCNELNNVPGAIAAELDMNDESSQSQFFDAAFLDSAEHDYCLEPRFVGELDFHQDECVPKQFIERDGGMLKVWGHIDKGGTGRPPSDRTYTIGGDIAHGTGASNSTLAVTDDKTGEKVAEYANPHILPHELARLMMALGRFYSGPNDAPALLIWEANGPGDIFGEVIIRSGYSNVWYRADEKAGWSPTAEGKLVMLGDYRAAQMERKYIDRSFECVREQREFVFFPDQTVAHQASRGGFDSSGARAGHGDRVIATALSYKGSKAKRPATTAKTEQSISLDTFYGRQLKSRSEEKGDYWRRGN